MYTTINYPTKKALKDALAAGARVGVWQPNDMFGAGDKVQQGAHSVYLEGPHYPKPHKWYATATAVDGIVTSVK
jgi:hypothetical protein